MEHFRDEQNRVARSNVCPELHKPDSPSFHAFSLALSAQKAPAWFVIAGSSEAQEKPDAYRDAPSTTATSADGMRDKIAQVMGMMERRMAAVGASWADTTATQIYNVFDFHQHLADRIVAPGGARQSIDWQFCRQPVIGLDFEMNCRCVQDELVLPALSRRLPELRRGSGSSG